MHKTSIFAGVVRNEDAYTQALCNLLNRNPDLRRAVFELFFPDAVTGSLLNASIATQSHLRGHGRPDIRILADDFEALIEVKTELGRGLTGYQGVTTESDEGAEQGYLAHLRKSTRNQKWLVHLIPSGWINEDALRLQCKANQGEIKCPIVTWEDLLSALTDQLCIDPLVDEFRLLLAIRFQPVTFMHEETKMLSLNEIQSVWKLEALLDLIATKAKSQGHGIRHERLPNDGCVGFYLMREGKVTLYIGCWLDAYEQSKAILCVGLEKEWNQGFTKTFEQQTVFPPYTLAKKQSWLLGPIPNDLLNDKDPATAIWEKLQAVVPY